MDPRLGDPTEEEEGCQQREAMPMPGGWEKPDFFMGQVGQRRRQGSSWMSIVYTSEKHIYTSWVYRLISETVPLCTLWATHLVEVEKTHVKKYINSIKDTLI